MPARPGLVATAVCAALTLAACSGGAAAQEAVGTPEPAGTPTRPPVTAPAAPAAAAVPADAVVTAEPVPTGTATLAVAGDVHFEGVSARALTEGIGPAADLLAAADLAVVNLETAVTDRGTPAPKTYLFRTDDRAFDVLADAGVDAVSLANNHAMDYGVLGLHDTLTAAEDAGVQVIGAGRDEDAAYAPLRTTVDGLDVSVLAVTDVLDTFAIDAWVARGDRPGMASAKGTDEARLLRAVRQEAAAADVVVVVAHWGREYEACPTDRQIQLADALAEAGADAVVGSHAHVPLPAERRPDGVYVHYGLGNFVFYAFREPARSSGVLTLEVGADGVQDARWQPMRITDGLPYPTGPQQDAAAGWAPPGSTC